MSVTSHIRRIALIAALGCAILTTSTGAATARPLKDKPIPVASTPEPAAMSSSEGSDWTLPIVLAGAVVIVLAGSIGYSYRAHTSRRVTA